MGKYEEFHIYFFSISVISKDSYLVFVWSSNKKTICYEVELVMELFGVIYHFKVSLLGA